MAVLADAGPVTSVWCERPSNQEFEVVLTCLETADGFVLALGLVAFGDDRWDGAACCVVAIDGSHLIKSE